MFEIRNYHIDPPSLASYKVWAQQHALPYLREQLDVIGFWGDGGIAGEVAGMPMDELGSANVTWIIRWESMAQREQQMPLVFSSEQWQQIFSHLQGGFDIYRRRECYFMDSW